MTIIRNPFDSGGYSLAEMTQAINILPNLYTRLGALGLFRFEGVSQRSVIIEQIEGVLNLLPSVPLGGPATVGSREGRAMRSFALPWIPHDDVILPADIQGVPAIGAGDEADPLVAVMTRKLTLMRRKHAQTREYMEMNALRGIVKDGAGTTVIDSLRDRAFTASGIASFAPGWFRFGTLVWTTGPNSGRRAEVLAHDRNDGIAVVTLLEAPIRTITSGDGFSIHAGCDKRIATCTQKFGNVVNFRGFPHIPGQDTILRYASQDGSHDGGVL